MTEEDIKPGPLLGEEEKLLDVEAKGTPYRFVVVQLKGGDLVAGPAIIHRDIGGSVNVENWIYAEFVVIQKPIRLVTDLNSERFVLSFGKYLNFTREKHAFIRTDSIQTINYMDVESIQFYLRAVNYIEVAIDPIIRREVASTTVGLERKIREIEELNRKASSTKGRFAEMISNIFGGEKPTIH